MAKRVLNIAVIGHIDAGKSTLVGQLVFQSGEVALKEMAKIEQEISTKKKPTQKFAWICDNKNAERQRGITIDSKYFKIQGKNYLLSFIDTPGHRNFLKNMITSLSQADVVVLVISAQNQEYEQAKANEGTIKEFIPIAFTLGVKQIVVAVTKMDSALFDVIKEETKQFINKVGYNDQSVNFIPVSGWTAENLTQKTFKQGWYKGKDLISILDNIPQPQRNQQKPLRIPISRMYKVGKIGTVAGGIIDSGVLKVNDQVSFSPSVANKIQVTSIQCFHKAVNQAGPGDFIGFNLKDTSIRAVRVGDICGLAQQNPPKQAASFTAFIVVLNHPGIIVKGYTPIFNIHTALLSVRFSELLQKVDRRTGEILQDNPVSLTNGDAAIVKLTPLKPVCVERFQDYPRLGRFVCRDSKQVVCVGVIKEVEKCENAQVEEKKGKK